MTAFDPKSPHWEMTRYVNNIPATLSGKKDASALIYTGPCLLLKVKLFGNGAAEAQLKVYDNTSAAGTEVTEAFCNDDTKEPSGEVFPGGGVMSTGIYCALTGAGARYYIEYYVPVFGT
jgi:hypothetical protein